MPTVPDRPAQGPDKRQWFVRMSNGSTFGPINTKGLVFWAEEGRIMPDDEISEDRTDWHPAQELPELGMETLIERPDGSFAGPFHPHAIQPLVQEGKIPPNARTFHRDELPTMLAARQMALFSDPPATPAPAPDETSKPAKPRDPERAALKRENQRLADRVAELETTLDDLRVQAKDALSERERETESLQLAIQSLKEEVVLARAAAADETHVGREQAQALQAQLGNLALERDAARDEAARQGKAVTALRHEVAEQTAAVVSLRSQLDTLALERDVARRGAQQAEAAVAAQQELEAQREELRTLLAQESTARLAAEEREAAVADRLFKLTAERQADFDRADRLAAELAQAQTEYAELLSFSNARDTEYESRLEAAAAASTDDSATLVEPPDDEPMTGEPRRIQRLESQVVTLRRELEEARQRLQQADVAATQATRPQEPEIARIEAYADAALATLQSVLEQERALSEQAHAASVARQEALHADVDRLQRALRMAPGEATRSQQLEQRNDRLIAKLKQELESARRQHQAELHQAAERHREVEQRAAALEKRESAARDQLTRAEQRAADHDSMASQLRRRENALLTAEREFETARQQWQAVETALMRRIEELESGASRLLAEHDPQPAAAARPTTFQAKPWMTLQR